MAFIVLFRSLIELPLFVDYEKNIKHIILVKDLMFTIELKTFSKFISSSLGHFKKIGETRKVGVR